MGAGAAECGGRGRRLIFDLRSEARFAVGRWKGTSLRLPSRWTFGGGPTGVNGWELSSHWLARSAVSPPFTFCASAAGGVSERVCESTEQFYQFTHDNCLTRKGASGTWTRLVPVLVCSCSTNLPRPCPGCCQNSAQTGGILPGTPTSKPPTQEIAIRIDKDSQSRY